MYSGKSCSEIFVPYYSPEIRILVQCHIISNKSWYFQFEDHPKPTKSARRPAQGLAWGRPGAHPGACLGARPEPAVAAQGRRQQGAEKGQQNFEFSPSGDFAHLLMDLKQTIHRERGRENSIFWVWLGR